MLSDMSTHLSTYGELEAMPKEDLGKEIVTQRAIVRKMRLGILLNKEKDTAKYRRERRQLARMLTVGEGTPESSKEEVKKVESGKKPRAESSKGLKKKPKTSTVTAPSAS